MCITSDRCTLLFITITKSSVCLAIVKTFPFNLTWMAKSIHWMGLVKELQRTGLVSKTELGLFSLFFGFFKISFFYSGDISIECPEVIFQNLLNIYLIFLSRCVKKTPKIYCLFCPRLGELELMVLLLFHPCPFLVFIRSLTLFSEHIKAGLSLWTQAQWVWCACVCS